MPPPSGPRAPSSPHPDVGARAAAACAVPSLAGGLAPCAGQRLGRPFTPRGTVPAFTLEHHDE